VSLVVEEAGWPLEFVWKKWRTQELDFCLWFTIGVKVIKWITEKQDIKICVGLHWLTVWFTCVILLI